MTKKSSPSGSVLKDLTVSTASKSPTPKTSHPVTPPHTPFNYEKYKQLKEVAQNAINDKKIFTIYHAYGSSIHRPLRKALIKRNWIEKLYPNQLKLLQSKSQHTLLHNAANGNPSEVAALSKLLHTVPVHFVWQPKYLRIDQPIDGLPFRNRLPRGNNSDFTRKECLVGCTKQQHWMHVYGRCELNCPRSYRMFIADEVADFVDDYRFTGCISMLSRVASAIADPASIFAAGGSVSTKSIDFAIKQINESLRRRNHKDIDTGLFSEAVPNELQWSEFFKGFNAIVRLRGRFREANISVQREWCENCSRLMITVRQNWSLSAGDGRNNIWIMKPGGKNCGVGIIVVHDCQEIVSIAERSRSQRYIVQKYLERPLLIHKTKFDIRQYFLIVARSQCVQLWMYRTCYLKFSSHEFCLDSTDESVHLTNHCVQKKYANQKNRSALLPDNNMWTLQQFKDHLVSIGEPDAWSSKIYPSIKRNATATMIASHNELNAHPNTFELYGGDFIINEKFESILLEVNASPDMSATTAVTRKICPECLADVIKGNLAVNIKAKVINLKNHFIPVVVVDKTVNASASTGNFELIHQISVSKFVSAENFILEGVKKPILEPMQVRQINTTKSKSIRSSVQRPAATFKAPVQVQINRAIKKNVNVDLNKVKQTPQAKMNHQDSRTKRVQKLLELHDMIGRLLHS